MLTACCRARCECLVSNMNLFCRPLVCIGNGLLMRQKTFVEPRASPDAVRWNWKWRHSWSLCFLGSLCFSLSMLRRAAVCFDVLFLQSGSVFLFEHWAPPGASVGGDSTCSSFPLKVLPWTWPGLPSGLLQKPKRVLRETPSSLPCDSITCWGLCLGSQRAPTALLLGRSSSRREALSGCCGITRLSHDMAQTSFSTLCCVQNALRGSSVL